jgi:hypothetical protein
MRFLIPLLTCTLAVFTYAADEPKAPTPPAVPAATIDAADAAAIEAATGKDVVVTGKVKSAAWSKSGKVMNVEFENSKLLAVVFEKAKADVDKAFDGDAAKKWAGAKVKVTGKLGTYGGKAKDLEGRPQIVISKADQVSVEPAEAAKPETPAK